MKRRERGAVMLEFALILPVLLLLVLGIFEYGMQYSRRAELNNLAFIAARAEAIHKDPAAAVSSDLPEGASAPDVIKACPAVPDPSKSENAEVEITGTFDSPTGFFNDTFDVTARGVARCEG